MLFHIQSAHSYKTCGANDPEKKKIMRSAFLSAEEKAQRKDAETQRGDNTAVEKRYAKNISV